MDNKVADYYMAILFRTIAFNYSRYLANRTTDTILVNSGMDPRYSLIDIEEVEEERKRFVAQAELTYEDKLGEMPKERSEGALNLPMPIVCLTLSDRINDDDFFDRIYAMNLNNQAFDIYEHLAKVAIDTGLTKVTDLPDEVRKKLLILLGAGKYLVEDFIATTENGELPKHVMEDYNSVYNTITEKFTSNLVSSAILVTKLAHGADDLRKKDGFREDMDEIMQRAKARQDD